jgi:lipoate---protein ligase
MTWNVEFFNGSAADFHGRDMPEAAQRTVWVFKVMAPALVLGSTQSLDVVDTSACAAAGVEVVKRRSGGGAVFLAPGDVTWIDVVIGSDDPLWMHDVGESMWWLGEVWTAALGDLGVLNASVHRGPMVTNEWSRLVCFAGLGPGEVVTPEGKLVGISQRRTRSAARFQCAIYRAWNPGALASLLAGDQVQPEALPAVASLDAAPDAIAAAFFRSLPG